MLFWMCKTARQVPNEKQIEHVILRNFSGFPVNSGIDVIQLFKSELCASPYPDEAESRKRCHNFLKDDFKKIMYNDVSKVLLQSFKDKHAKTHKEQILKYSTDKEIEEYWELEFIHCYDSNDFEDPEINKVFKEMQDKYCKERFDNEVGTCTFLHYNKILYSCGHSSLILIIHQVD